MTTRKFEFWPIFLILFMGAFVVLMISLVVIASRQPLNLVDENYYEKSISYEERQKKLMNARELVSKPDIDLSARQLTIQFPESTDTSRLNGSIYLYSPINKKEDIHLKLNLDSDKRHVIDLRALRSGKWEINLEWTYEDMPYLIHQTLIIGP